MTYPEDVLAGLRAAGKLRAQAERDRDGAMGDIACWLRMGREMGVPITQMADAAGVTRPTVYALTRTPEAAE